ncbi:MAG: class I SAM-dependent methyltransferase [Flavobacteriales bacterium]
METIELLQKPALTRQDKVLLRGHIFKHLDGIVTSSPAYVLHKRGITNYILEHKKFSLEAISEAFNANEGYMNVALRILCAQGWLNQKVDNKKNTVEFSTNKSSKFAFSLFHLYEDAHELIKTPAVFRGINFNDDGWAILETMFDKFRANYGLKLSSKETELAIQRQVLKHIEGVMVGPVIVSMGMNGMFHKYFSIASFRPEEFHKDHTRFKILLDFLGDLGWFRVKNETYKFTEVGLFFAKRASAYGVTVSYMPNFRAVEELVFGNANALRNIGKGADELHVDREMNVWGSGGAHSTYFKKIDEVVIDLFNKPIHEQPKGILDMGCGNGALLEHIFEIIATQTKRGELLDEYPLFLVGADFNKAALNVTRGNLIQADIWAKVIWGDIGQPELLAEDLREDYGIELADLLSVRSFLDHNRVWTDVKQVDAGRVSDSTGSFAHRGVRIDNNSVEQNLKEHFEKWTPYVKRFGLLVIELHSIDPGLTSKNLGSTAATAYDATHGFSDQYIVEIPVYLKAAEEAGLEPAEHHQSKFPNSELATVSINLLKGV